MKKPEEIEIGSLFDEILQGTSVEKKEYISKSLEIAHQIITIMEAKGMLQKDLANKLGKSEAEVSKWLSGFHNFTINTIVKIETVLDSKIITTPKEYRTHLKETFKIKIQASTKELWNHLDINKVQHHIRTSIRTEIKSTTVIPISSYDYHLKTTALISDFREEQTGT